MTDMEALTAKWEQKLRDHPELADAARLRWTKYIPHKPTPAQRAFLMLPDEEAFFGGAAGGGKCLTPDHEVLVRHVGWVHIDAVAQLDEVLSWNEQTNESEWSQVLATWHYGYQGYLRTYRGRNLSFRATPNHKWRAGHRDKQNTVKKWRWYDAKELKPLLSIPTSAFCNQYHGSQPSDDPQGAELELWGWYLSEGSGIINGRARISQTKDAGRQAIKQCCDELGIDCLEYEKELRPGWKPDKPCGTNAYDKYIPSDLLEMPQRFRLFDGLMGGDGYQRRQGWEYSSSSERLIDSVQCLAQLCGFRTWKRPKKVQSDKPHWVLSLYPRSTVTVSPEPGQLGWEEYDGPVACLTTTHGNFFVRHNGAVHVTGNSDALLMGALQYVDVPRYSALILRKTIQDLTLPGALIDRSRGWLTNLDCKFRDNAWYFPNGAIVQFGYLEKANDRYRYQGGEYQYIAFDELTHFNRKDYEYLRSRLRRAKCPQHEGQPEEKCQICQEFGLLKQVPLRIRAASNPGGVGHNWVRDYFQIHRVEGIERHGRPLYMGQHPDRRHVPSFIEDNPYLDQEEYRRQLSHLDVVTMEQLLAGNWGISSEGRFKTKWAKFYSENADYIILGKNNMGEAFRRHTLTTFMIVDTAATSKEVLDDPSKNKDRSNHAIGLFGLTPKGDLLVMKFETAQCEVSDLLVILRDWYRDFRPEFLGMEYTTMSRHLFQIMQNAGFTMRAFTTGGRDKVARSAAISQRMNNGQVYFPQWDTPWRTTLFNELFTWTGDPNEQDDQVDVMSYAGIYAAHEHQYGSREWTVADEWFDPYAPEAFL